MATRVLLVEDDADIAELVDRYYNGGFRSRFWHSGRGSLAVFERFCQVDKSRARDPAAQALAWRS